MSTILDLTPTLYLFTICYTLNSLKSIKDTEMSLVAPNSLPMNPLPPPSKMCTKCALPSTSYFQGYTKSGSGDP